MMKIAKFEKVSKEQFIIDFKENFSNFNDDEIIKIYDDIKSNYWICRL